MFVFYLCLPYVCVCVCVEGEWRRKGVYLCSTRVHVEGGGGNGELYVLTRVCVEGGGGNGELYVLTRVCVEGEGRRKGGSTRVCGWMEGERRAII